VHRIPWIRINLCRQTRICSYWYK